MWKILFVSFLLVGNSMAFWTACRDRNDPTPTSVASEQCSTVTNRCIGTRGTNLHGTVNFNSASAQSSLPVNVRVLYLGIWTPLPVDPPHDNACNSLVGSSCPIGAGTDNTWNMNFPISDATPVTNGLPVQFSLGDAGNPLFCFEVLADIS